MYTGDDLASSEVEVVKQRQFTLQEVDLLGRASGFEVGHTVGEGVAGGACSVMWLACLPCTLPSGSLFAATSVAQVVEVHGDFDAEIGLDHEEAYRSVVCLRRQ
jgi:hypothetical protein